MRKRKGSALIIAIMLIAAIGAIAFGIGKLLFLEVGNQQIYENGSIAYYAAESGIEEGLLRYRYNQNSEVPFTDWTLGDTKAFGSNLSTNTAQTGSSNAGVSLVSGISNTQQSYDLRIGYLGTDDNPWYGHLTGTNTSLSDLDLKDASYSTGNYSVLDIQKDDSVKIDLTGLVLNTGDALKLMIRYKGADLSGANNNYCNALMETTFTYDPTDGSGVKQYKSLLNVNPSSCSSVNGININKMLSANTALSMSPSSGYYYTVVDNIVSSVFNEAHVVIPASDSGSLTLALKPLNYSASIGLMKTKCATAGACTDSVDVIAGPFTTIQSTGYYGGVTRKLVANIDRQSGTLYDLFDYVINKN